MRIVLGFLFAMASSTWANESLQTIQTIRGCAAWLTVRGRIERPASTPQYDFLFLEGFGDRSDNHGPLFDDTKRNGGRIISFDYPGQGESLGWGSRFYGFGTVLRVAAEFEKRTREEAQRPLIVAGWSTGGLAALRSLQNGFLEAGGRRPSALVLLAPGLFPRLLVGERGFITEPTLTRNPAPPHHGPAVPSTPFAHPLLAGGLLINSWLARIQPLPPDVPVLILAAGSESDRYVRTSPLRDWARGQIQQGSKIWYVEYPGAYHELDNEIPVVSLSVRKWITNFSSRVVDGQLSELGSPGLFAP